MKNVLLLFFMLCFYPVIAQNVVEDYTYVSDCVVEQTYGLPVVRTVGGGTKIIVDYQGNWSEDMKGAFEYACKIWEEAMPTTFPIHILAILDETRNTSAYSKVSMQSLVHQQGTLANSPITNRSTWLQMKGTTMTELIGIYNTQIYTDVLTPSMFYEYDVRITYYNKGEKLKDNCSFSLDEVIDNTKYDFVSLVLRDIAKGFGVMWQYNNPNLWPYVINVDGITPYESMVLRALGFWDINMSQNSMYTNATQGSLELNDIWNLYAPKEWNANYSLSTFIPTDGNKISKLLSYDFGKGSVVRDICDASTSSLFSDLLYWKGDVLVGGSSGTTTNEIFNTNDNVIEFNGNVTLPSTVTMMASPDVDGSMFCDYGSALSVSEDTIYDIIKKYHPGYDGTTVNSFMGSISLLLKDGTWDKVYTFSPDLPLNISVSNFKFHYANEDYARTTDGYLRCRISKMELVPGSGNPYKLRVRYYALDYLPQVVVMAKSKIVDTYDDEFYTDVEISYKNIEGTTRIVVSQYDDGEDIPFQFALSNIKSGKFIATVDKEYPTTFIITSYNKNGATTSETYVLDAVQPISDLELSFAYVDGHITVKSNSRRMRNKEIIDSYSIAPLGISQQNAVERLCGQLSNNIISSNTIDVSGLPIGLYVIKVVDIFGKTHSFKFAVK